MGIYTTLKDKYPKKKDREIYDDALNKFNQLEKLANNSNIKDLDQDVLDILTVVIYLNKELLKEELEYIIKNFDFWKKTNNFNLAKVNQNFTQLVKEYQIKNNLKDHHYDKKEILKDIKIENEKTDMNVIDEILELEKKDKKN